MPVSPYAKISLPAVLRDLPDYNIPVCDAVAKVVFLYFAFVFRLF